MEEYKKSKLELEININRDYSNKKLKQALISCAIGVGIVMVGSLFKEIPYLESYGNTAVKLLGLKVCYDTLDWIFLDAKVKSIESKLERMDVHTN